MAQDNRYTLNNFIVGSDKAFIQANIQRLKEASTNYFTVTPGVARRLDLISEMIYGTVSFKWVIIYCNDLIDLSILEHGYILRYPTKKDILAALNETSEFL